MRGLRITLAVTLVVIAVAAAFEALNLRRRSGERDEIDADLGADIGQLR